VLDKTEIRVPKPPPSYRLPEAFRQHVTAWPEDAYAQGEKELLENTDILEIAAASGLSFYIPDSTFPESHCYLPRVKVGNVDAQFVSPLAGGSNNLVGTLQIGFKNDKRMDREEMGLWASYSQAVAAALERAFEIEERTAMEKINEAWNAALQRQLERPDWDNELRQFTQVVKEALHIDYVHLRIDRRQPPSGRYELFASSGDLSELHRKVRPALTDDQGSIKMARDEGMLFTNRREETLNYYAQASLVTSDSVSMEVAQGW
jgi:hypothetical protein